MVVARAYLPPKLQPGGFDVPAQVPQIDRMERGSNIYESEKARMSRIVMESMQGRFTKPAPYASFVN